METKHTPGPWTSERMRLTPRDKDRRCGFVVNGPDSEPLPVRICDLRVPAGIDGFSQGEANARLIAAAPELLYALKKLLAYADWYSDEMAKRHGNGAEELGTNSPSDSLAGMARRAIMLAEGRVS